MEAYPLHWPIDYPRSLRRRDSRFKTSLARARDYVKGEVKRIEGQELIISTNIPLKNDGDLRADWSRFRLDDPGVAVYFMRNKNQVCLCCDNYNRVWENLYAVGRTIEALRQIDRDGVSDFLDRTFTGFKALPESSQAEADIWKILQLKGRPAVVEEVHTAYKNKAKVVHPDTVGGSNEAFQQLQQAYKHALKFFTL